MLFPPKKITVFLGYYGSGKTEVALNYAVKTKEYAKDVAIADFDFVNPFFRTADAKEMLLKNGIEPIILNYANTNVEMVTLNPTIFGKLSDEKTTTIIDVGGDDAGATALGAIYPHLAGKEIEVYYVANCYRPFNETPEAVLENMREIESACRLKITGIINNSNLAKETTENEIVFSKDYAKGIEELSGVPIVATSVRRDIITDKILHTMQNVFPIEISIEYIWNK